MSRFAMNNDARATPISVRPNARCVLVRCACEECKQAGVQAAPEEKAGKLRTAYHRRTSTGWRYSRPRQFSILSSRHGSGIDGLADRISIREQRARQTFADDR